MKSISAYPLQWPLGWKRTLSYQRKAGQFRAGRGRVSVIVAAERVLYELSRLTDVSREDMVISSNVPTRLDGWPRSDLAPKDADPGVAVYWTQAGHDQPRCLATDVYLSMPDNLAAIAATLEALRAIERHGGATILNRTFMGLVALEAPSSPLKVLELVNVLGTPTRDQVDLAYRQLVRRREEHSNPEGRLVELNLARDGLYKQFGWT